MTNGAEISDCGLYRYMLWRTLDPENLNTCMFIMLNPSTADAAQDDPTIRRCVGYTRDWGYGRLIVCNLFAYRAMSPKDMKAAGDPIGEENLRYIRDWAKFVSFPVDGDRQPGFVVCAWGSHGAFIGQDVRVLRLLKRMRITPTCLAVTKEGQPRHPLYLRRELVPVLYEVAQ